MSFLEKNNKFTTYLIILFALFIVVLFTRGEITTLQENLETKEIKEFELQNTKEEQNKLDKQKASLNKDDSSINKFLKPFNEDELIDYIYGYIENLNSHNDGLVFVKNISFTKGEINEIGFIESKVELKLRVPNEEKMKKVLNFLVKENSEYNFYIDSFKFPNVETESSFNVTIPLRVLYK